MTILRTILVAVGLHGVFSAAIPFGLLRLTRERSSTFFDFSPGHWAGLGVILLGMALYCCGVGSLLKARTSAVPFGEPGSLKTDGLFSIVRHPTLLGVVLVLFGEGILFQSFVLLGYAGLYWVWLHLYVILREERDLLRVFGDRYAEYCKGVPRWLPRLSRRRSG